jgi:hypothetical protein
MIAATTRPAEGAGVYAFHQGAQHNSTLTQIRDGTSHFGNRAAKPINCGHHPRRD